MRVAAVVLAAGSSSRLGMPKQLLSFRGSTLIRRAATAAVDAGCTPVVVVTGASDELSRRELEGLEVRVVFNAQWESGLSSSIRAGVGQLSGSGVDAAVLMLCDQPHVSASVISALIEAHRVSGRRVVASAYGGSFGVPALFSQTLLGELAQLQGAGGARQMIGRYTSEAHFVPFPAGEVDVDTADDVTRLIAAEEMETNERSAGSS